jgi:hypothetical protein
MFHTEAQRKVHVSAHPYMQIHTNACGYEHVHVHVLSFTCEFFRYIFINVYTHMVSVHAYGSREHSARANIMCYMYDV